MNEDSPAPEPTPQEDSLSKLPRSELDKRSAGYVVSPRVFEAYGAGSKRVALIIEVNLDADVGRSDAHSLLARIVADICRSGKGATMKPADSSRHHIFAKLSKAELKRLIHEDQRRTQEQHRSSLIYKVWVDRQLEAYLDRSVRIIKADACLRSYGSDGSDILWAVADSGIDEDHPHFALHGNLILPKLGAPPARSGRAPVVTPIEHRDFTSTTDGIARPLMDDFGHGTHVAGIIAGEAPDICPGPDVAAGARPVRPKVFRINYERDDDNRPRNHVRPLERPLRGVAPKTKLLSLKVLDKNGNGDESGLISAIDYVSVINDDGRWLRIHGVNLSLGYAFEAEWFAAGQSPICVAVNRLVKQGVVVVVAAGNDGSAMVITENSASGRRIGLNQSITDPGNAELAITVGSTHPEQPHTYGISYFSSRGPTADGRPKPDLVAPGERILSAASPGSIERLKRRDPNLAKDENLGVAGAAYYREESGTSMAAPHVSGAVAAFLSVRREFIGQPEQIKTILMNAATDLKRTPDFQGAGLIDLMRAIQSI